MTFPNVNVFKTLQEKTLLLQNPISTAMKVNNKKRRLESQVVISSDEEDEAAVVVGNILALFTLLAKLSIILPIILRAFF